MPNELVTKALGKRYIDSVWQVQTHAGQRMYVLIEFQRTPHPHMALRTCVYSGLLYETLLAHEQIPAQSMWPPVLCIVLYHGDRSWHASTRLRDRIWRPRRGLLKPAMLQHRHLLLDIGYITPPLSTPPTHQTPATHTSHPPAHNTPIPTPPAPGTARRPVHRPCHR